MKAKAIRFPPAVVGLSSAHPLLQRWCMYVPDVTCTGVIHVPARILPHHVLRQLVVGVANLDSDIVWHHTARSPGLCGSVAALMQKQGSDLKATGINTCPLHPMNVAGGGTQSGTNIIPPGVAAHAQRCRCTPSPNLGADEGTVLREQRQKLSAGVVSAGVQVPVDKRIGQVRVPFDAAVHDKKRTVGPANGYVGLSGTRPRPHPQAHRHPPTHPHGPIQNNILTTWHGNGHVAPAYNAHPTALGPETPCKYSGHHMRVFVFDVSCIVGYGTSAYDVFTERVV